MYILCNTVSVCDVSDTPPMKFNYLPHDSRKSLPFSTSWADTDPGTTFLLITLFFLTLLTILKEVLVSGTLLDGLVFFCTNQENCLHNFSVFFYHTRAAVVHILMFQYIFITKSRRRERFRSLLHQ